MIHIEFNQFGIGPKMVVKVFLSLLVLDRAKCVFSSRENPDRVITKIVRTVNFTFCSKILGECDSLLTKIKTNNTEIVTIRGSND